MIKKRAKNLSDTDIKLIVEILDGWSGKLTWDLLIDDISLRMHSRYTRQALNKHERIRHAFDLRKKSDEVTIRRASSPELQMALERIARLEAKSVRLESENQRLLEQFVRWAYNAHTRGLDQDFLNRPLPSVNRRQTNQQDKKETAKSQIFPREGTMELIILGGIQAAGKTRFYNKNFSRSHVRLSLDELKSRKREKQELDRSLATKKGIVVDNTNTMVVDRARFIGPAKAAGYRVICYFFEPDKKNSLLRNNRREGAEKVPQRVITSTLSRLERPRLEEGFDDLYFVYVSPSGEFNVRSSVDSAE
jgi:predicted kinase